MRVENDWGVERMSRILCAHAHTHTCGLTTLHPPTHTHTHTHTHTLRNKHSHAQSLRTLNAIAQRWKVVSPVVVGTDSSECIVRSAHLE